MKIMLTDQLTDEQETWQQNLDQILRQEWKCSQIKWLTKSAETNNFNCDQRDQGWKCDLRHMRTSHLLHDWLNDWLMNHIRRHLNVHTVLGDKQSRNNNNSPMDTQEKILTCRVIKYSNVFKYKKIWGETKMA